MDSGSPTRQLGEYCLRFHQALETNKRARRYIQRSTTRLHKMDQEQQWNLLHGLGVQTAVKQHGIGWSEEHNLEGLGTRQNQDFLMAAASRQTLVQRSFTASGMGKRLLLSILHEEPGNISTLVLELPLLPRNMERSGYVEGVQIASPAQWWADKHKFCCQTHDNTSW